MFHPNFIFQIKLISKFHSKFQANIDSISASDRHLTADEIRTCANCNFHCIVGNFRGLNFLFFV